MLGLKMLKYTAGRTVKVIKTYMITKNPGQPRQVFNDDDLLELSESIKMYGILNPLTVRRIGTEHYELIAGERRLRAARLAGLTEVPCVIISVDEKESSLIALVENLQRQNLDFFEEAMGYKRLIESYGLTQEEAAKKVGKTQSSIANKMRLLRISGDAIKIIKEAGLTERHARALLRITDNGERLKALKYIVKNHLNVMQTEMFIDSLINGVKKEKQKKDISFVNVKDVRFFLNTINHALSLMRQSGMLARCERENDGDELLLKIRIKTNKT